jgi:hypothetical protein
LRPDAGGQSRGVLVDAAPAQCAGERDHDVLPLDQVAFEQLRVRGDHRLAAPLDVAAEAVPVVPGQGADDDPQRIVHVGRLEDPVDERRAQRLRPVEQDVALLGDVAVEVVYDLSDAGLGVFEGIATIRTATVRLGAGNPLAHHVTNVLITEEKGDAVTVRSKGLVIMSDGRIETVNHVDTLRRQDGRWRISRRVITAQRAPVFGPVG